jgi:Sec-independent protein translocase protein TatA
MLSPLELIGIIILIIILVILLKPDTLVKFGRGLGELRREMKSGESIDEETIAIANKLGIKVEGKTKEEILEEINKKLKSQA